MRMITTTEYARGGAAAANHRLERGVAYTLVRQGRPLAIMIPVSVYRALPGETKDIIEGRIAMATAAYHASEGGTTETPAKAGGVG